MGQGSVLCYLRPFRGYCTAESLSCLRQWHIAYLCSKQGQHATAGPNVHDNLAVEISCVLKDSSVIGACSDLVLEHVLLVHQHSIVMEIQISAGLVCFDVKVVPLLLQTAELKRRLKLRRAKALCTQLPRTAHLINLTCWRMLRMLQSRARS